MLSAVLGDLWVYLVAGVAFATSVAGAWWRGRKSGRDKVERRLARDQRKREGRGRDAVEQESAESAGLSNRDIVERMRRRDGDFGGL